MGAVTTAGQGEKTPRSTLVSRLDLPISLGAPARSSGTTFQLQRTSLPPGLAPRAAGATARGSWNGSSLSPSLGTWGRGELAFFGGGGGGWGLWQSPRRDCARPAAREAPRATSVNATPPARPGPAPAGAPGPGGVCCFCSQRERERDGCWRRNPGLTSDCCCLGFCSFSGEP